MGYYPTYSLIVVSITNSKILETLINKCISVPYINNPGESSTTIDLYRLNYVTNNNETLFIKEQFDFDDDKDIINIYDSEETLINLNFINFELLLNKYKEEELALVSYCTLEY